ncbi:MAG: restriction endonuclease subunit S, partial [Caldilineaceae bacterium]|nr:restriction endonuclease subunit S [Caldilineaceae bacterium]
MSELPKGWVKTTLTDIASRIVDGSHTPPEAKDTGGPMLSARNIDGGKIHFTDYRLISEVDFERENRRSQIAPGDVLLTIVGAIGRSAVVPKECPSFTLQRSVAVIKPESGINPYFLSYQFSSPLTKSWLLDNAKGTAQKGIYLNKLGTCEIILPPLAEQRRIVAKLDSLFARTRRARAELARIPPLVEHYKQAILAAAFRGDLTMGTAYQGGDGDHEVSPLWATPASWRWRRVTQVGDVSLGRQRSPE